MSTGARPPVWVEVHVDDELLARDPRRWPEARELVLRLTGLAEGQGARLSFRIRTPFARASAEEAVLPALLARGHGLGVHAHGSDLARATAAFQACGVAPEVAVPGLVQAGEAGRDGLLALARDLGFQLITDHGPTPAWAYEGLLERAEQGLQVMAPTVRPFDWGLMDRDGRRHGLGPEQIARLRRLEAQAAAQGARWFGLALHEHDLCPPGSLTPREASLEALADYLDERVQTALSVARGLDTGSPRTAPEGPSAAPSRARALARDGRLRLVREVRSRTRTGGVQRLRAEVRGRLGRRAAEGAPSLRVRVDGESVPVDVLAPPEARGLVLMSHAGAEGGRALGLRPFGLSPRRLHDQGWALWTFDRRGSGQSRGRVPLTPGHPSHARDVTAVLERARGEGLPVVILSWSAGVLPVLKAAVAGSPPDALVDAEGPADRWSLRPPPGHGPRDPDLDALDPWSEAHWHGREPVALLPQLGCPYGRLQARPDHVHGDCVVHAERMVDTARRAGLLLSPLEVLPGPLHGHGEALIHALSAAFDAA